MRRMSMLLVVLAALALPACARPAAQPTAQPTTEPAPAATSAPAGGFGVAPAASPEPTEAAATAAPSAQTAEVTRGAIEDILVLSGEVKPLSFDLSFDQDGIIASLAVKPGDTVAEGQLVAELDQGDLPSQLRQAELNLAQQEAALNRQIEAGEIEVRKAELDLDTARGLLAEAKAAPTAVAIAEAEAAVRQAQANLDLTRNNASQQKNLALEALSAAVIEVDAIKARIEKIKADIESSGDEDTRRGLRAALEDAEEQLRAAESNVRSATVNLDTARNNEIAQVDAAIAALDVANARLSALKAGPDPFVVAERERAVRRAELLVAQARQRTAPDASLVTAVETARLQIDAIKELIAGRQVFAPFAGEVVAVNTAPGQPVRIGDSLITLSDPQRLEVVAAPADERAASATLQVGQPIDLTFAAHPGVTFAGTISQVPDLNDPEAIDLAFHIGFDPKSRSFSVGDAAEGRVVLGRKATTLLLPIEAVRITRDRASVLIPDGDGTRRVEVVTGIVTDKLVEILGGLEEGDVVIIE